MELSKKRNSRKVLEITDSLNLDVDENEFHRFVDELDIYPDTFNRDGVAFDRLAKVLLCDEIGDDEGAFRYSISFEMLFSGEVVSSKLNENFSIGEIVLLMPGGRNYIANAGLDEICKEQKLYGIWNDAYFDILPDFASGSFYHNIKGEPPCVKEYNAFLKQADDLTILRAEGDEPHPSGAFLHGDSFAGKTTSVVHFLERWASINAFYQLNSKRRSPCYKWFEAAEFAELAKNKAKFGQTMEWIAELVKVKFLIIDDMDKFQLSESVEVAFFDILKRRIENGQGFTVITSNQGMDRFVKRFAIDRRKPIENRLKQFFRPFKFIAGE